MKCWDMHTSIVGCKFRLQKELQTGVAIANSGCEKELETEIAERICQTQLQQDAEEARDDEAGNAETNLFRGSSVGLFLATL